jgi:deoxycytidylate deaminase
MRPEYLQHHDEFLQMAATLALQSDMQHCHGCVLIDQSCRVVGKGFNYRIQKGVQGSKQGGKLAKFSIHAEEAALRDYINRAPPHQIAKRSSTRKMNRKQERVVMYVVRVAKDHRGIVFKCSKPCQACQQQIEQVRNVSCVYFSDPYYS